MSNSTGWEIVRDIETMPKFDHWKHASAKSICGCSADQFAAFLERLEAQCEDWLKRAEQLDDKSGTSLCSELASHYRDRGAELRTLLGRKEGV